MKVVSLRNKGGATDKPVDTDGLAQKRQLIERLQEDPGPEEREQIERQLEQINAALDSLEQAGSGASG